MRLLTLITLIALLVVGCSPETYAPTSKSPPITEETVQQPTIPSEVVAETPTLVLATDTITPTVETIVDTPTPPTSGCFLPSAHAPLEETFYGDYPYAIRDFINAGATPGELAEVLYALTGWVARMESQRRSERTKAGLARVKAHGKRLGRPPGSKDGRKRKRRRSFIAL